MISLRNVNHARTVAVAYSPHPCKPRQHRVVLGRQRAALLRRPVRQRGRDFDTHAALDRCLEGAYRWHPRRAGMGVEHRNVRCLTKILDSTLTRLNSHSRDNKLHVWARVVAPPSVGDVASSPDLPMPGLRYSLDVNALNFCRFSLLPNAPPGTTSSTSSAEGSAYVAVPNLVESSLVSMSI